MEEQEFKIGEYVELRHLDRHEREGGNHSLEEGMNLFDSYKILKLSSEDSQGKRWFKLKKDGLWHHPDKFSIYSCPIPVEITGFCRGDLLKVIKPQASGVDYGWLIFETMATANDTEYAIVYQEDKPAGNRYKLLQSDLQLVWRYQNFQAGDTVKLINEKELVPGHNKQLLDEDDIEYQSEWEDGYRIRSIDPNGYLLFAGEDRQFWHSRYYFKLDTRAEGKQEIDEDPVIAKQRMEDSGWNWISLPKL